MRPFILFFAVLLMSITAPARLLAFTISGPATATVGQSCTYTASTVFGCDVDWTVTGGVISSPCSNTTTCTTSGNSITVVWNCSSTGVHRVYAEKAGVCIGTGQLDVTITAVSMPTGAITGSTNTCPGTGYAYSVSAVSGATSYSWTLSGGGTITSGNGTTGINVTWSSPGATRTVTVTPYHYGCASTQPASKSVFVNTNLGTVSNISGSATVCPGATSLVYSIAAVTGATAYSWSVPAGFSIVSGNNTPSITVNAAANAQSGNISVTPSSPCTTAAAKTLMVTVPPLPAAATVPSGPPAVCIGGGNTVYTEAAIANATGYTWTITGGSIVSGAGTNSVTVNWTSAGSGTLTVKGTNSCGNGTVATKTVTIYAQPPAHSDTLTFNHAQMSTSAVQPLLLDHCALSNACGNCVLQRAELVVTLQSGSDYELGNTAFACNLEMDIRAFSAYSGGTQLLYQPRLMSISNGSPEQTYIFNFTGSFAQAMRFDISVRNYSCSSIAQGGVRVKAYVRTRFSTAAAGQTVTLNPVSTAPGSNKKTFSWNAPCSGFPGYEFQLLRLYNTDPAFAGNPLQVKARIDWNSALTVETSSGLRSLTLSLVEGSGYYAWRVRPIGDAYAGGIANDLNWGQWSASGTLLQDALVTVNAAQTPYCFYYNQFDGNLNWSYSRVFTENEEGTAPVNIKETMTYANGTGLATQTQTLLNTQQQLLVQHTVYDYCGRDALRSMPAPVPQNSLQFIPQFVQQTAGHLYTAADFDADGNYRSPLPMENGYPALYYSDATASGDSTVPASGGYPYTRTLYAGDGTNRAAETSIQGEAYRITNAAGAEPHTLRTLHTGVSPEELLRVFGDEAPRSTRVAKTISLDADNRATVTYVCEGQTIATCIAAGTAANTLDSLNEPHGPVLTVNELVTDAVSMGSGAVSASKPVAFVTPTTLRVYYSITPKSIAADCGSYCAACDYRVYFLLHNISDPYAPGFPKKDSLLIPGGSCPAAAAAISPFIQYTNLPAGSYLVEKRLFTGNINPASGRSYLDEKAEAYRQQLEAELDPYFATILAYVNTGDLDGLNTYLQQSGLPLNSAGNAFVLSTSCCSIEIPYEHCSTVSCQPVDFEQQLTNRWASDPELGFGTSISSYFQPAWSGIHTVTAGSLNTLVTNMLNDPQHPYDCALLQQCWKGVVDGYKATRQQFISEGRNYDPIAHFLGCAGLYLTGTSTVKNTGTGSPGYANPGYLSHAYTRFRFDAAANQTCINTINALSATLGMNLTYPYPDTAHWHWQQLYNCVNSYAPGGNTNAAALADTIEKDCRAACEARYEGFVNSITAAFRNDPRYVIEGEGTPAPGQTLVTLESIWCSARSLVTNCQSSCNVTVQYSGTPPPLHVSRVGTPAEIAAVEQAMTWAYAVSLPNSSNQCAAGTTAVAGQDTTLPLLVNYLNNKLDEFKATIGPGINYMPVYQLADAFRHSLVTGMPCFTPADSVPVSPSITSYFYVRSCGLYYKFGTSTQDICNGPLCTVNACQPVCFQWILPELAPEKADTFTRVSCAQQALQHIAESIHLQRSNCLDAAEQAFRSKYVSACTNLTALDSHRLNYSLNYFHYTLYYYDRAGQLLRSVPPAGVQFLDPALPAVKNRQVHPAHTLVTEYEYNSLGQLIREKTADGGEKKMFYNKTGQLRFVQDAEQLLSNAYSYCKYDALGRNIEKGRSTLNGAGGAFAQNVELAAYPSIGTQKTFTVYSSASGVNYSAARPQRYLLNRVASTYTDKDGSAGTTGDRVYTYFSYDPHGNVEWIISELPELGRNYMRYEYDPVTKKPLRTYYNEGKPDQFIHRYSYDADSRLLLVETSSDNETWDRDAAYGYALHGPLKRVLMGEDKIQGLDYVYTLNGMSKGINHPALDKVRDPGKDGAAGANSKVAKDVFGMLLAYYKNDFERSNSPFNSNGDNPWYAGSSELFGGQVTSWVSNTAAAPGGSGLQYEKATGFTYSYDLLGRLSKAQLNDFNAGTFTPVNDYLSKYSYDANGNLLSLDRNGYAANGLVMDRLSYSYYAGTNRLKYVTDAAGTTAAYASDMETQTNTLNYTYDGNGRLKSDAQYFITNTWNNDDKLDQVLIDPAGTASDRTLSFTYDAAGRRVIKKETATASGALLNQLFYVTDVSGSVLGIYRKTIVADTAFYTLIEMPMYGSGRLGIRNKNILVKKVVGGNSISFGSPPDTSLFVRETGRKLYEIKDHMNNVRAVVSDVKQPVNVNNLSLGFTAQLLSYSNMDPFGMEMPGRTYSATAYRYGYGSMEKDDELLGAGNSYTAEFWQYDPRLGRRWNRDPVENPSESPYAAFHNNPVSFNDPQGNKPRLSDEPRGGIRDVANGIGDFFRGIFGGKKTPAPQKPTYDPSRLPFERDYGGPEGAYTLVISGFNTIDHFDEIAYLTASLMVNPENPSIYSPVSGFTEWGVGYGMALWAIERACGEIKDPSGKIISSGNGFVALAYVDPSELGVSPTPNVYRVSNPVQVSYFIPCFTLSPEELPDPALVPHRVYSPVYNQNLLTYSPVFGIPVSTAPSTYSPVPSLSMPELDIFSTFAAISGTARVSAKYGAEFLSYSMQALESLGTGMLEIATVPITILIPQQTLQLQDPNQYPQLDVH